MHIKIFTLVGLAFLHACSKEAKVDEFDPMGEIDVVATVKFKKSFAVRYKVPDTDINWHCAGANYRKIDGRIYLDFIAAHNADDGAVVDLPATSTKREDVHQVTFDYKGGHTKFDLFIDGKKHGSFELNMPDNKQQSEQDESLDS